MGSRFVLVRLVSADTNWNPMFALKCISRMSGDAYLVTGRGGSPVRPFWFQTHQEVFNWIRDHAESGSTLEWEGMVF